MGRVLSWLLKAAKGSWKGGRTIFKAITSSKGWKYVRPVLRAADLGLTGYFIYDIFWSDGEDNETAQESAIMQLLFPRSIVASLHAPIDDNTAFVNALNNVGLHLMCSPVEENGIQGLVYLGAANYFSLCSTPDMRYKSNEELVSMMKKVSSWDVDTDDSEAKAAFKETMLAFKEAVEADDVDDSYLKQLDYLLYQMITLHEYFELEIDDTGKETKKEDE